MNPRILVALALADTFLACDASLAGLIESATWALGKKWRWIPSLCKGIHERTGEHFHYYSRAELAELIASHTGFSEAWQGHGAPPCIRHYCVDPPMPVERPAWVSAFSLPHLATIGDVAQWLDVTPTELDWFADKWRTNSPVPTALQHYHYRWVKKNTGGLRLIEIPKIRLRTMQRHILRNLLDRVPPHEAAHGFRRAHSCATHAALHAGKRVVIRMDLRNFFSEHSGCQDSRAIRQARLFG